MSLLELLESLAGIEHWDFSDRRSTLRIPCGIDASLEHSGKTVPVVVEDIGLQGLRLLVLGKVRKGSIVELSAPDKPGEPVRCRIEWKREHPQGFVTGASFKDSAEQLSRSWLFQEVKSIGEEAVETKKRRRGVRVICNTSAQLKVQGEKIEINMIDLGLGGALIEGEGLEFQKGDTFRLAVGPLEELPRMVVNGSVVTVHQRELPRYGVAFDSFFEGGVTDVERYLTHFYELRETV